MTSISIVTAVRNAAGTVGHCLGSVAGQTVPAEHIVVDGGSTDGTLDVIRASGSAKGGRWVTGPDQGIYDAINKGIGLASGDIVGTLNADDFYPNPHVLEKVAAAFDDPTVDASYGDLLFVQELRPRLPPPTSSFEFPVSSIQHPVSSIQHPASSTESPVSSFQFPVSSTPPPAFRVVRTWRAGACTPRGFYWGWMPPHPTFFVRRKTYERLGPYRLDLGTAADYELMLRYIVRHGIGVRYIPEVLVHMRAGGVSTRCLRNRLAAHRMDRLAWEKNDLKPHPWTVTLKPLRKLGQLLRNSSGPARDEASLP